jgi:four helix bundle protein
MNRFKELVVWKKSVELATDVYSVIRNFPSEEKFGLVSQLNRCAVSIPSNIAEGSGRNSNGEFNHFLGIAVGSSFEMETQLVIANKLNYLTDDQLRELENKLDEVQRMLFGLQKSLNT